MCTLNGRNETIRKKIKDCVFHLLITYNQILKHGESNNEKRKEIYF